MAHTLQTSWQQQQTLHTLLMHLYTLHIPHHQTSHTHTPAIPSDVPLHTIHTPAITPESITHITATSNKQTHTHTSYYTISSSSARKPPSKIDMYAGNHTYRDGGKLCLDNTPETTPPSPPHPNFFNKDLCTVPNLRLSGSCTYRVQNLKPLTFQ